MVKKPIFIAFAVEDEKYRNFLVAQSKNENSPFDFIDMSVKSPWDEKWKTNCRERIKGCHGLIALVSKNTSKAGGELWEIQCGYEEGIPTRLMWINGERPSLPALIKDKRINIWSWENLKNFIRGIKLSKPQKEMVMNNMRKHIGLDDRERDQNGRIREKRGDTRVGTLRRYYGADFAKGYRSDTKLATVRQNECKSLSQLARKN